jgi:hypothetical protein
MDKKRPQLFDRDELQEEIVRNLFRVHFSYYANFCVIFTERYPYLTEEHLDRLWTYDTDVLIHGIYGAEW